MYYVLLWYNIYMIENRNNIDNSNWRRENKIKYFVSLAIISALIISYFIYNTFFSTVSCYDNKQNGDERGVDCGGGCAKICQREILPLYIQKGDISISEDNKNNTNNIYIIISNDNNNTLIQNINLKIRLLDKNNNILKTLEHNIAQADNNLIPVVINSIERADIKEKVDHIEAEIINDYTVYINVQKGKILKFVSMKQDNVGGKSKITIKYTNPNIKSENNFTASIALYNSNGLAYIYKEKVNTIAFEEVRQNIFYIDTHLGNIVSAKILLNKI